MTTLQTSKKRIRLEDHSIPHGFFRLLGSRSALRNEHCSSLWLYAIRPPRSAAVGL